MVQTGNYNIAWYSANSDSFIRGSFCQRSENLGCIPRWGQAQAWPCWWQWTPFTWNDAYQVHRSASPYFTPDETSLADEVAPPESEYLDTLPGSAWYYLVLAEQDGLAVSSKRTARFQYSLAVP